MRPRYRAALAAAFGPLIEIDGTGSDFAGRRASFHAFMALGLDF